MKRKAIPNKVMSTIERVFENGKEIDAALRRAAMKAHRIHKQAKVPLVVWEKGKVVLIPPNKIRIK